MNKVKLNGFMTILLMFTLSLSALQPIPIYAASRPYLNYIGLTMSGGCCMKLKVNNTAKKVKWKSSNKKIATVNKNGKVTGKKKGKCTVTATVGKVKLKCKVKITSNQYTTVRKFTKTTLNISSLKLDLMKVDYTRNQVKKSIENGSYTLEVLNNSDNIVWSSSNNNIATVDEKGKVTAVSVGKCTVTATTGGKKYNCKVEITNLNKVMDIYNQEGIYEMLALINKDRAKAKVAPLKIKEQLNQIADIRAEEASIKFSHSRPNNASYSDAYNDIGLKKGSVTGENLATINDRVERLDQSISVMYKALYKSQLHRKNMLSPKFEYIGIGPYTGEIYKNEDGIPCMAVYFAQEFYTE